MQRVGKSNTSKTIREPYRKSRRFDASCRCHGGCPWCERNRLHKRMVAEMDAREAIEEVSVKSVNLSEIEQLALQVLAYPQTCTELADRLWDQRTRIANRQSWARPAGAIIARLSRAGLVHRVFPPGWEVRPAQYQTVNSLRERTDQ